MPSTDELEISGLIRFFPSQERLESFISGDLYLNTPHFYRSLEQIGVGDDFDACIAFYSSAKHKRPPHIVLDGVEQNLTEVSEVLIFRDDDRFDAHLQCWFVLATPETDQDLADLKLDLSRVQQEFGIYYSLLPIEKLEQYLQFVQLAAMSPLQAKEVTYTEDRLKGSMFVKHANYAYQREYRVALGRSKKGEIEPRRVTVSGLSNFILANPYVKITIDTEEHMLLTPPWHRESR
jgi:hypothetical protein